MAEMAGVSSRKLAPTGLVRIMVAFTRGSNVAEERVRQRKLTLKWADLVEYGGNRAQRGGLLPRGLRRVDRIETTG